MVSRRMLCSFAVVLQLFAGAAAGSQQEVNDPRDDLGTLEERKAELNRYIENARAKLAKIEEEEQEHRDMLIRGFLCRAGFPTRCVCTEEQLREAILAAGPDEDDPAIIQVCGGDLDVDDPIDISRRSIFINCQAFGFFSQCNLVGNGHIFEGSPALAIFDRIIFKDGNNRVTKDGGPSCGGAFYLTGGITAISGCVFEENEAGMGGAIYVTGADALLQVDGSTFDYNYATYDWLAGNDDGKKTKGSKDRRRLQREGGGETGPLVPPDLVPLPEIYPYGGGAIMVTDSALGSIIGCTFTNNEAEGDGGAIMIANFSQVEIAQCTFDANEALNSGGAVATDFATAFLGNSTFSRNDAVNGGAIASSFATMVLGGCVFGLNEADTGFGNDIFVYDDFDFFNQTASLVTCEPLVPADINIFCDGMDIDTILENGYNFTNTDCDLFGEEGLEGFNCPTDGV